MLIFLEQFFQSIDSLTRSTSEMRHKMRFMEDKMMANDHKMTHIKRQVKDQQKLLSVEQENLSVKRNELVRAQHSLKAVQEQKIQVRESIRDEVELARIDSARVDKDFFSAANSEVEKEEKKDLLLTVDVSSLLKKKLMEKVELLRFIEPMVKQMSGKFYIRLSKRKQKNQLKSVHKQLTKDVSNLNKALEIFA